MKQFSKFIMTGILFAGVFTSSISAQQNNIKLYSNFLFLNSDQEPRRFNYKSKSISYRGLSAAYQLTKKEKRVHEWEVGFFYNNDNSDSLKFNQFDMHLRYEIGRNFKKKFSDRLELRISYAAKIFYLREVIDRNFERIYQEINNAGGISISPFFHAEYALSKQIYFDLNATLGGATIGLDFQYYDNPALTERQKKQGGFDFDLLKEHVLRVGVGYRFGAE